MDRTLRNFDDALALDICAEFTRRFACPTFKGARKVRRFSKTQQIGYFINGNIAVSNVLKCQLIAGFIEYASKVITLFAQFSLQLP